MMRKIKRNKFNSFFYEKNHKKLVPRGNTGHSINWSEEQLVVGIIGFHPKFSRSEFFLTKILFSPNFLIPLVPPRTFTWARDRYWLGLYGSLLDKDFYPSPFPSNSVHYFSANSNCSGQVLGAPPNGWLKVAA